MFRRKTVFIVGAGASQEFNLPLGSALRDQIVRSLRFVHDDNSTPSLPTGMYRVLDALVNHTDKAERRNYIQACHCIIDGVKHASSIDDFVDQHREYPEIAVCAKLAIVDCILKAERESPLRVSIGSLEESVNFTTMPTTWMTHFYRLLTNEVAKSELDSLFKNVSFICFNYDRCIENYLIHVMPKHYFIGLNRAAEYVKNLKIYRPYGTVGTLTRLGEQVVDFGSSMPIDLKNTIASIRTYTERSHDPSMLEEMKKTVEEAEVLVFLGNAYWENNLRLFRSDIPPPILKRIFATREGIHDADLDALHANLLRFHSAGDPHRIDRHFLAHTCANLFDSFKLSLRS